MGDSTSRMEGDGSVATGATGAGDAAVAIVDGVGGDGGVDGVGGVGGVESSAVAGGAVSKRIADDYLHWARRRDWVSFLGAEEASSRVFAGAVGCTFQVVRRPWSPGEAVSTSEESEPCLDVCEEWVDSKRCFEVLDALDDCHDLLAAGDLLEAYARLSTLHREEPSRFEIQELLLDVLFGLGLDENDFRWVERPRIVRLDQRTRDRIHLHLCRCGPKDAHLLRFELFHREYLCFDEETLTAHLRLDPRFEVREQDWSRESGWDGQRIVLSAVPEC